MTAKMKERVARLDIAVSNDPLPKSTRGRHSIYNFAKLNVGECIKVTTQNQRIITSVRSAAYRHSKKYNIKLTTRLLPDGVGVWRTA